MFRKLIWPKFIYTMTTSLTGNAFRFPGALPNTTFGSKKVEVAAQIYSEIHGQIIPHAEKVTSRNVESLKGLDYASVRVDTLLPVLSSLKA